MSTASDHDHLESWIPSTDRFGARLALVRWHKGWNAKEAALACGLPHSSWRDWESGAHPRDAVAVCGSIAAQSGVNFYWLLTGNSATNPGLPRRESNTQSADYTESPIWAKVSRRPAQRFLTLIAEPYVTEPNASLLAAYRTWTQAGGASPQTLQLRCHYLTRLAAAWPDRDMLDLTPADLAEFLARPGWQPETRRSARSALKSFYKWACDTEQITRDPTRMLPQVKVPAGKPKPTPELIFADALAGADERGRRLLLLAGLSGLRRAEIAKVHSGDVTAGELRVVGKGLKVRTIPLHPLIVAEMTAAPDGWLFPNGYGGHLSAGHVGVLIKRLLGPGWSAHSLRHRFATRAYAVDRDLLAVQELLGHSKPETTRRYVVVPDGALRTAVLGAA